MTHSRFAARLRAAPGPERGPVLDRAIWEVDGRDWPNREHSRFVTAAGGRWHVQVLGEGPPALLLHGTGAATHSWARLAPLLARRLTVIAPDLPGHGFTEMPPAHRMSLPGMAEDIAQLLAALGTRPQLVVGHSAGAAILCRMCLDGWLAPRLLVSLNGALLPFRGLAGRLFAPMARLAASTTLLPRVFAWHAGLDADMVRRLIRDTGSHIGGVELAMYRRLARRPGHVAAAIAMMAHWELEALVRELPRIAPPPVLMVGARDRAVPPSTARHVRQLVPAATIVTLPGLGHLAHEEQPEAVAARILDLTVAAGLMGAP